MWSASAARTLDYPLSQLGFTLTISATARRRRCMRDPEALTQAILNLLGNAMKYSGDARHIEMRIGTRDGEAFVDVVDHGIGIPRDDQSRIFERFHRVQSAETAGIAGTGLGLAAGAACRRSASRPHRRRQQPGPRQHVLGPHSLAGAGMTKVLVVEDDPGILRTVADNLRFDNTKSSRRWTAKRRTRCSSIEQPDLIVLDLMLPRMSGLELCRRLRTEDVQVPVLMLTARSEEADRVLGLDLGADDYVTKPFSVPELMARIRALLRRASSAPALPATLKFGQVEVDFRRHVALRGGQPVEMTRKEFALLRFLASREDIVVTRDELLNKVWGFEAYPVTRTVDNHIAGLRAKLEADPARPGPHSDGARRRVQVRARQRRMTRRALTACLLLTLAVSAGMIAQTAARGVPAEQAHGALPARPRPGTRARQSCRRPSRSTRRRRGRRAAIARWRRKALIRAGASREAGGSAEDAANVYAEVRARCIRSSATSRRRAGASGRLAPRDVRRAPSTRAPPSRTCRRRRRRSSSAIAPVATARRTDRPAGSTSPRSSRKTVAREHRRCGKRWSAGCRPAAIHRLASRGQTRPTYRAVMARLQQALDAAYAADRTRTAGGARDGQRTGGASRGVDLEWRPRCLAARRRADAAELHETRGAEPARGPHAARPEVRRAWSTASSPTWLSLDKLKAARPDPSLFPQVDADLMQAMETETRLFLESQLRDDHDAVELWTANYTYVNERLAATTAWPASAVRSSGVSPGRTASRAGILGQAGPLTALSMPSRTSPTVRGVYVLTRFLGDGRRRRLRPTFRALAEQPRRRPGAMRDRMLAHKTNPSCASCHVDVRPAGSCARELRCHRRVANAPTAARRSMRRARSSTAHTSTGPPGFAPAC